MAADVLRGETLGQRSGQWICLFCVPLTIALAAAPYPLIFFEGEEGGFGYEIGTWYVRAFFVALALLALRVGVRVRQPMPGAVLEIDTNSIRWTSSRGKERTIARAAVQSTNVSAYYLNFKSAIGERIPEIPILLFGYDKVEEALERHHWNVE